jgi:TM2 domain-containing membrane protein YozV/RNA polymerase subunit RPABC4/transcription elongation factor Spt4
MTGAELSLPGRQADQKHCFSCGKVIHMSAGTCPFCGAGQQSVPVAIQGTPGLPPDGQRVFCRGCGSALHVDATVCPKCGAPQVKASATAPKSRVTAAVLALFLGGLGIHRFYLNQPVWGFVYLIFCWTFIPAGIAFIEALIFLFESDEKFAKAHGG